MPRLPGACVASRCSLAGLRRRKFSRWARPWRKSVGDLLQHRRQLGEMALQHCRHVVVVDPIDSSLSVHCFRKVVCEEAVTSEPSRRHQDEDTECRIAKAESLGWLFCVHADHQIDLVGVAVDLAQSTHDFGIIAHLLKYETA